MNNVTDNSYEISFAKKEKEKGANYAIDLGKDGSPFYIKESQVSVALKIYPNAVSYPINEWIERLEG